MPRRRHAQPFPVQVHTLSWAAGVADALGYFVVTLNGPVMHIGPVGREVADALTRVLEAGEYSAQQRRWIVAARHQAEVGRKLMPYLRDSRKIDGVSRIVRWRATQPTLKVGEGVGAGLRVYRTKLAMQKEKAQRETA